MSIERFVSEKMFSTCSRIFSGKMIKHLLRKDLIWSKYDDQWTKEGWFANIKDNRYYVVDKRVNEYDETDYWFQITRIYRNQYPEEREELKALQEGFRRERKYHRNPRPSRIKG